MNNEMKCVMIIDGELPTGIIANTAAILGITLGKHIPALVGDDIPDGSGMIHRGIITIPVPVLKAPGALIKALRERLSGTEYRSLITADFSDVAQSCNVYSDYRKKAAATQECDFTYLGLALYGEKKLVNSLTGSLPLLR